MADVEVVCGVRSTYDMKGLVNLVRSQVAPALCSHRYSLGVPILYSESFRYMSGSVDLSASTATTRISFTGSGLR